jgi:hypothetical protein
MDAITFSSLKRAICCRRGDLRVLDAKPVIGSCRRPPFALASFAAFSASAKGVERHLHALCRRWHGSRSDIPPARAPWSSHSAWPHRIAAGRCSSDHRCRAQAIAAVFEPSEPSMKPFSIPVCSMLSDAGCESRLLVQVFDRVVKRQPLGNPRGQLSVAFEFFVNLKVFPLRKILRGGDAVTRQIRERQFDGLPALVVRRLGNHRMHQPLALSHAECRWACRPRRDRFSAIGIAVATVMLASCKARVLATPMCPSTRQRYTGCLPLTSSRSQRVGRALTGHRVSSQPRRPPIRRPAFALGAQALAKLVERLWRRPGSRSSSPDRRWPGACGRR